MLVAYWTQIREKHMNFKLNDHGKYNFALNEMDEGNAWAQYMEAMMDTL
jgi:hypothetical protein